MTRPLLVLLLILCTPAAIAQPAAATPWMTGARLVKLLGNVDASTIAWDASSPFRSRAWAAEHLERVNGEFVHGYIQGVHDATEGKQWCWDAKYKPAPDELVMAARHALQRMPAAQLSRNASDLIVEVWRARWPCDLTKQRTR